MAHVYVHVQLVTSIECTYMYRKEISRINLRRKRNQQHRILRLVTCDL